MEEYAKNISLLEQRAMRPSLVSMIQLFEQSGFRLSAEAYGLLWRFHQQIRDKNETLDLTRIKNFENMVIKHYVDSIYVTKLIALPSPLLDIGSGAGFPGIPIKIVQPAIHIILAEGRKKRASFMEDTCELLGLEGIEVYPHKIPGSFDTPVGGVITRALEVIPRTLERVFPLLAPGGKAVFMKGPHCDEEIEEAGVLLKGAYELEKDVSYSLPGTPHKRRLIVFNRLDQGFPSADMVAPAGKSPAGSPQKGGYPSVCGQIKEIVSPNNPKFKAFMKLLKTRGIRKQGRAFLSGGRQVREVLDSFPGKCRGIVFSDPGTIPEAAGPLRLPCYRLHPDLFRQLDIHDTGKALLQIMVAPFDAWKDDGTVSGCALIIPFQDPRNVGAVIRSAAAFGVSRVVVLKEAAHPFHPASLRAAGSTIFRTKLLKGPSLQELEVNGVPLITLSPEGDDLASFRFPETFCLAPGLEGPGLPDRLKKAVCLSIPMAPGVESLNAATATGIALYAWKSRA
jgi:16S rRNA (guanine(527)-N(7))-methyltransferase RsmG